MSKNTTNQELSSIKTQLSECYSKSKPVLLYGNDSFGRMQLILGIHHKEFGGTSNYIEYVGKDKQGDAEHLKDIPEKIFINKNTNVIKRVINEVSN